MIRGLFISSVILFGIVMSAEAIVVQSASKAMSFQSTVRSSGAKKASASTSIKTIKTNLKGKSNGKL